MVGSGLTLCSGLCQRKCSISCTILVYLVTTCICFGHNIRTDSNASVMKILITYLPEN